MQILIHRYQLRRIQKANSKTNSAFQEGALIQIQDEEGNFGVADICPWPSLGDLTLDQELNQRGPLFKRAFALAQKDYEARQNKISLITETAVDNHILVTDYHSFDFSQADNQVVKIKGDSEVTLLAEKLNSLKIKFKSLRLDFNFCLDFEKFKYFLQLLNSEVRARIECIEDPTPFNKEQWIEMNELAPLALDWGHSQDWSFRISKPSRDEIPEHFFYMTSVMDHPIGVAHGLSFAQKFPDKIHGFLTLDIYEPTSFHSNFICSGQNLRINSGGYGIGFDQQLNQLEWQPLIDWTNESFNQLLINPKFSANEKKILNELKVNFDTKISKVGYFIIPSSGSSQSALETPKLIALKKQAVLNSARRVNDYFKIGSHLNWGCLLPTFHVGGLGILARAFLSHGKVFYQDWSQVSLEWIEINQIHILSLVPTQIFDLVQKKIKAPPCVRLVFVGGANLTTRLGQQALELGWPLVQTFGMTETASMIAVKESVSESGFQILPGVEIAVENGQMKVRADSLAEYSIQKIQSSIELKPLLENGWLQTNDVIHLDQGCIHFQSRLNEVIKISGEGVSLPELRSRLQNILIENQLRPNAMALLALVDERRGYNLCLATRPQLESQLDIVLKVFNHSVRPYEKINFTALVPTIPLTELQKIKYTELHELVNNAGPRMIYEAL